MAPTQPRLSPTTSGRPIRVLDYQPADASKAGLCPPGAIAVYILPEGSNLLQDIENAVRAGGDQEAKLGRVLARRLRRAAKEPAPAGAGLALRHGGRTLASGMAVPPAEGVVRLLLPYTGGQLAGQGLVLTASGSEAAVEVIALRRKPPLTRIESEALRLLPDRKSELNVGPALGRLSDDDDRLAQAENAMEVTMERNGGVSLDGLFAEKQLADVTAAITVRALLAIRADALKRF